jgi:MarR family transcriptional regulator, organic hydroperoxide resistance regulator
MENQQINEIEQKLRDISVWLHRMEREIWCDFPLTSPQYTVLLLLAEYGDLTIGELSQRCCLACSTMTDLVDRMEKRQLIQRQKDARDRRVIRIHLLDYGQQLLGKVRQARQAALASILADVSAADIDGIQQSLARICEKMKGTNT